MDQSKLDAMQRFLDTHPNLSVDLARFDATARFALDHLETWREQFPDQWIAAYNSEFVAHSPDPEELRTALRAAGISPAEAYVTFLAREREVLVL